METDAGHRPGASDELGGPAQPDAELLLAFLATAPEPLRDWAEERAAEVRAEPQTLESAGRPGPAQPTDPADLALAEIGEDDDEARRRPMVHTPSDKVFTPVAKAPKRGVGVLAPLVGLALVAAVVYGVFLIGRPADSGSMLPAASAPVTQRDDSGRIAELEQKLAEKPDDIASLLELGVLQFDAGDLERAEELWTRVTELDPRNPSAWFNLGFLHLAEDPPNMEEARVDWEKVLEVAPDSDLAATIRSHLDALSEPSPSPSATSTGE